VIVTPIHAIVTPIHAIVTLIHAIFLAQIIKEVQIFSTMVYKKLQFYIEILQPMLKPNLKEGYEAMNRALGKEIEAKNPVFVEREARYGQAFLTCYPGDFLDPEARSS